jgi:NTE family protein
MTQNNIHHIVLSGGAYLGLYQFGVLKYLNEEKFFELSNIKSIHGTSIGGFIGAVLCLNIEWTSLIEYFVKRPWNKSIQITPNMIFEVLPKKGFFGEEIFIKALEPLFKSKEINTNISLIDFYELTKKELYFYSVNLNRFELVQISYKTHPELSLIKAINMTCALPYVFQPVLYESNYYIDGALLNNYPVNKCLETMNTSQKNILSLKFKFKKTKDKLNENTNLFEYGYILYKKLIKMNRSIEEKCDENIENEVLIPANELNINEGFEILNDEKKRNEYIEKGEMYGKIFLTYKSKHKNIDNKNIDN